MLGVLRRACMGRIGKSARTITILPAIQARHAAWDKGCLVGQRRPLLPKHACRPARGSWTRSCASTAPTRASCHHRTGAGHSAEALRAAAHELADRGRDRCPAGRADRATWNRTARHGAVRPRRPSVKKSPTRRHGLAQFSSPGEGGTSAGWHRDRASTRLRSRAVKSLISLGLHQTESAASYATLRRSVTEFTSSGDQTWPFAPSLLLR